MRAVQQVPLFLASPGDVSTERGHAERVVDELAHSIGNRVGRIPQVVRWERDARPSFGQDAQALVNQQIASMDEYDLFVGIMWNRAGSRTPRALSGTVEEYQRAADAYNRAGIPD